MDGNEMVAGSEGAVDYDAMSLKDLRAFATDYYSITYKKERKRQELIDHFRRMDKAYATKTEAYPAPRHMREFYRDSACNTETLEQTDAQANTISSQEAAASPAQQPAEQTECRVCRHQQTSHRKGTYACRIVDCHCPHFQSAAQTPAAESADGMWPDPLGVPHKAGCSGSHDPSASCDYCIGMDVGFDIGYGAGKKMHTPAAVPGDADSKPWDGLTAEQLYGWWQRTSRHEDERRVHERDVLLPRIAELEAENERHRALAASAVPQGAEVSDAWQVHYRPFHNPEKWECYYPLSGTHSFAQAKAQAKELCGFFHAHEARIVRVRTERTYFDKEAALSAAPAPPAQATVTLAECPIGLFYRGGELCLKTEYGDNDGRIDAYIVSSGEFFWGGASTRAEQRKVLVTPVAAPPAQVDRDAVLEEAAQRCDWRKEWADKPKGTNHAYWQARAIAAEVLASDIRALKSTQSAKDGEA